MIRGLYAAASGMLAGERLQDVVSNNLANAGTNGYKKEDGILRSFPEELQYRLNDHTGSGPQGIPMGQADIGSLGSGVFLEQVLPRFTQGVLKPTDNKYGYAAVDVDRAGLQPTDANYNRRSFFPINDERGQTVLGRDGNFHLDREGYLRTSSNQYVQATNIDSNKAVPNSRLKINDAGVLEAGQIDPATNQFTADPNLKMGLVDVIDTRQMKALGNGIYSAQAANIGAQTGELRGQFVEGSNVDPSQSMVDMITVLRSYEANQRVIKTLDRSLDHAVNEIGRI